MCTHALLVLSLGLALMGCGRLNVDLMPIVLPGSGGGLPTEDGGSYVEELDSGWSTESDAGRPLDDAGQPTEGTCPGFDDTLDRDQDGLLDGCDLCPDDAENDADGDGFCANEDNCPRLANPAQSDTDNDGLGDACDDDAANGVEFSYPPSNVDVSVVPTSTLAIRLNCGTSVFDSTSLSFSNWCGLPTPTPTVQNQTGGPSLVILPFHSLDVASGATLRLIGDRPVVLLGSGDIEISGVVDASATGTTAGAGGDWSCGTSAGTNGMGTQTEGGGGGGGGGFGSSGAAGGYGDNGTQGEAGVARGVAALTPLLGGCNGGLGGGCAARGAAGGGSMQLTAAGAVEVRGTLRADGGHGETGCEAEGGGTGGGSGGAILVEAMRTTLTAGAVLSASGGNGGEGARDGGGKGVAGGMGGVGSAAATAGTHHFDNGGGGGGGSVGRIRVRASVACSLAGSVSPAASSSCP